MAVRPPLRTRLAARLPFGPRVGTRSDAGPGRVEVVGPEPGERPVGRGAPAITSLVTLSPLRPDVDVEAAETVIELLPVGEHSPFHAVGRTHYARIQVLSEVMTDERRPLAVPVVVLAADVDGDARSWLEEVLDTSADQLARVLALCDGAPADPSSPRFVTDAVTYLLSHRLPVGLQYVNTEGRTAADIRLAVRRHRRLAGFVLGHGDDTPAELRAAFLDEFRPVPPTPPSGGAA